MRKPKFFMILIIIASVLVLIGFIFLIKNDKLTKSNIQIIDATFRCDDNYELFYEDNEYSYYFLCTQSTSTYVKFKDGTKVLLVKALEDESVTIDEVLKTGFKVYKEAK